MSASGALLILDDNEDVFESLEMNFNRDGQTCLWAANREDALRLAGVNEISAAIIDLSLGNESGLDAMRDLLRVRPGLPVVFISGYGTLEAAVSAVKMGAYDFLPKPINFRKLRNVLNEAVRAAATASEAAGGTVGANGVEVGAGGMVVAPGGAIVRLLEKADRIADSDMPLLITGESGSGKELLAEYIHRRSLRRDRRFVRINCSAITDSLAESELFGHARGAFTGAAGGHKGYFEQADGGTIHLDEIGDMSLLNQARILRVLEERSVRPVGAMGETRIDIRVIASTNKDLGRMAAAGTFRFDLYYRLNGVELSVPPLRERPEDIRLLVDHFLRDAGGTPGKRFSENAMEALLAYPWPGNVRELRNAVKASALLNPETVIDFDQLPHIIRSASSAVAVQCGRLEQSERETIVSVLEQVDGNRKAAAKRLGISLRTLYYKLDRYGF